MGCGSIQLASQCWSGECESVDTSLQSECETQPPTALQDVHYTPTSRVLIKPAACHSLDLLLLRVDAISVV